MSDDTTHGDAPPSVIFDTSATDGVTQPKILRCQSHVARSEAQVAVEDNKDVAQQLRKDAAESDRVFEQEIAWQNKINALRGSVYIGHTNTDMDSVASALGCAELYGGTAARATAKVNNEIATCLRYWGLDQPPLFKDVEGVENRRVCLVDHQQTTQFAEGLREDQVCGIIDHHSLKTKTVCTAGPIYIDVRPWGSACTIVAFDFFRMREIPSKQVAGMLLSGILSDTLNLKGPTTTEPDRVMVAALAQVAEVEDINKLARMQFKAKSAELSAMTDTEVVLGDHKVFEFSCDGKEPFNVGFGVCECVTPAHDALLERAKGLREEVLAVKSEKNLEYSFFAVVDIVELKSHLIVCGPAEAEVAELAFGGKVVDGILPLGNRVSRKNDFMKHGVFPILSNPDFKPSPLARKVSLEQQSAPSSPLAVDAHLGCCGRVTRENKLSTAGHAVRAVLRMQRLSSRQARARDGDECCGDSNGESLTGHKLFLAAGAAGLLLLGATFGRWTSHGRQTDTISR